MIRELTLAGARQGGDTKSWSVRAPHPPRNPRLHQHRAHPLVALHRSPRPRKLLLHLTYFYNPTLVAPLVKDQEGILRSEIFLKISFQSGGGPLTFVPGGLKVEGSTEVIFHHLCRIVIICACANCVTFRLLGTW